MKSRLDHACPKNESQKQIRTIISPFVTSFRKVAQNRKLIKILLWYGICMYMIECRHILREINYSQSFCSNLVSIEFPAVGAEEEEENGEGKEREWQKRRE